MIIPDAFAQVGDVGTQLIVTCLDQNGDIIDIAAAATLVIKLGYPDETTTKDCTASLYTDGSDGNMVYVTQANDLNQAGLYTVQGKFSFASGPVLTSGNPSFLLVRANVDNA